MGNILKSEYIFNEKLNYRLLTEIIEADNNSEYLGDNEDLPANSILDNIRNHVGNILDEQVNVYFSQELRKKIKSVGYEEGENVSKYLFEIIDMIVRELTTNAFDAIHQKPWYLKINKEDNIRLKICYNKEKNTLLIRIRDNGIGCRSNNKKKKFGGDSLGDLYLQNYQFVSKYNRYLGLNGCITEIKIDLNSIQNKSGYKTSLKTKIIEH